MVDFQSRDTRHDGTSKEDEAEEDETDPESETAEDETDPESETAEDSSDPTTEEAGGDPEETATTGTQADGDAGDPESVGESEGDGPSEHGSNPPEGGVDDHGASAQHRHDTGSRDEGHAHDYHDSDAHAHDHSTDAHAHDHHDSDAHAHDHHDSDAHAHDHHHHDVSHLGVAVVTVSSSRSIDEDASGDIAAEAVRADGHEVPTRELIADDYDGIQTAVDALVGRGDVDAVITSGGTGVTPDDVTIEAVEPLFDKHLPGFGELFRALSHEEIGTRVVGTRATAGIVDGVPVFCLPGSENAVRLGVEEIVLEEAGHLAGLARRED